MLSWVTGLFIGLSWNDAGCVPTGAGICGVDVVPVKDECRARVMSKFAGKALDLIMRS